MIFLRIDRDERRLQWRALMNLGFGLVVAGELALCCVAMGPAAAAAVPLGVVLLIAGALHLYEPVRPTPAAGRRLQSLAAAVYLAAGAWLICNPSTRADGVAPALGAWFIGGGALQLRASLLHQRLQWGWIVLAGVFTAILGVLMVAEWPRPGIQALGGFAGLELLVAGITYLGLAWSGWRSRHVEDSINKGEAPMGFDQQGILVFVVKRGSGGIWDVYEKGFDEPLASFDRRREACDYAHGLAGLKAGSLVISDPPDDSRGLSFA